MSVAFHPRVALETLGCKLNQYETDALAAGFTQLGWKVVSAASPAEAYVVNTCTVTNKADRKSRNTLAHFLCRPGDPIVVVTGCFAESARESLEGKQGITYVVANQRKNQIPSLVDAHFRGEIGAQPLPVPDSFEFVLPDESVHTRASLKIQDGCDNFCSFCIIPSVRGRAQSRPLGAVVEAAKASIGSGRKELVLTGVNMGRWQEGRQGFTALVGALLNLDGDFRVRITSLEPEGLGEEFASLLAHPKMCSHLHLCLQSGSPRMLLSMRRSYNLDQFADLVSLLRSKKPDLNLTTDLIVGFPGETEHDFQLSLDAVGRFGLSAVHVFPFSKRRETRAERMPEQISDLVKSNRREAVQTKSLVARRRIMAGLVGRTRRVLVETRDTGRNGETLLKGFTEDYFPVQFKGETAWNQFVSVRLKGVVETCGELVFEGTVPQSPEHHDRWSQTTPIPRPH